jgi:hypothetical protein
MYSILFLGLEQELEYSNVCIWKHYCIETWNVVGETTLLLLRANWHGVAIGYRKSIFSIEVVFRPNPMLLVLAMQCCKVPCVSCSTLKAALRPRPSSPVMPLTIRNCVSVE